jgi:hypothetical protein
MTVSWTVFEKKLRTNLGPELSPFSTRGSKQSSESEVQNLKNRRSSPPGREQAEYGLDSTVLNCPVTFTPACRLTLSAYLGSVETAWFDDFEINRINEDPI